MCDVFVKSCFHGVERRLEYDRRTVLILWALGFRQLEVTCPWVRATKTTQCLLWTSLICGDTVGLDLCCDKRHGTFGCTWDLGRSLCPSFQTKRARTIGLRHRALNAWIPPAYQPRISSRDELIRHHLLRRCSGNVFDT